MASIDQDFAGVAKGVGDVAAAIESMYPNGPPMPGKSVPELPPPEFPRTRSATDQISGVQQQMVFQSAIGATKKTEWRGRRSAGKEEGLAGGKSALFTAAGTSYTSVWRYIENERVGSVWMLTRDVHLLLEELSLIHI